MKLKKNIVEMIKSHFWSRAVKTSILEISVELVLAAWWHILDLNDFFGFLLINSFTL